MIETKRINRAIDDVELQFVDANEHEDNHERRDAIEFGAQGGADVGKGALVPANAGINHKNNMENGGKRAHMGGKAVKMNIKFK